MKYVKCYNCRIYLPKHFRRCPSSHQVALGLLLLIPYLPALAAQRHNRTCYSNWETIVQRLTAHSILWVTEVWFLGLLLRYVDRKTYPTTGPHQVSCHLFYHLSYISKHFLNQLSSNFWFPNPYCIHRSFSLRDQAYIKYMDLFNLLITSRIRHDYKPPHYNLLVKHYIVS